jgi:hypothetical protein
MTKSLPQKTHAETLIKVTEEYTLRPKTGDRARVCIATLQYLLDNFAYDLEPGDDWDSGISGQYVDTMDIHYLIYQLQKLK